MAGAPIDRELHYEIEQFLYREATLLDQGRLYEWLDLFTEDTRYWMPVRETIQGQEDELNSEEDLAVALFDDDKEFLIMRVKRLDTGLAHAEQPRSRTRHLITNVQAQSDESGELVVHSNLLVFQGRLEHSDHTFFGRREDRLRHVDGQWKIAERKIFLDHTLLSRSLSILF